MRKESDHMGIMIGGIIYAVAIITHIGYVTIRDRRYKRKIKELIENIERKE